MAQTFHSAGTTNQTGYKYGALSENDAFTIQKKFLTIAKRNLVFARFAQKETKAQNDGLEVRWRRYEKFNLPLVPLAEGVKPPADNLTQVTMKVKMHQYGSYVNTTDVLVAAHTDPVIQQITERQSIQAAELMDFLSYLHLRTGTQAAYSGNATAPDDGGIGGTVAYRNLVNRTIGGTAGRNATLTGGANNAPTTKLLDTAIRALENNEATKIAKIVKASSDYDTSAIPDSYIAVCHPDLRQDIEDLPGYVPYQKYANGGMQVMPGEIGAVGMIRFIVTTQAAPFGHDPFDANTTAQTRHSLDTTRLQNTNYTPGFASTTDPTYAASGIADSEDFGEVGLVAGSAAGSGVAGGELGDTGQGSDGQRNYEVALETVTVGGTAYHKVYPVLIFSSDAIGCVSMSGFDSVVPKVVMPQPAVTDPLGQTGSVGWKSWYACKILQEEWLYRVEVACSSLS